MRSSFLWMHGSNLGQNLIVFVIGLPDHYCLRSQVLEGALLDNTHSRWNSNVKNLHTYLHTYYFCLNLFLYLHTGYCLAHVYGGNVVQGVMSSLRQSLPSTSVPPSVRVFGIRCCLLHPWARPRTYRNQELDRKHCCSLVPII